jgi:hypothetical protein
MNPRSGEDADYWAIQANQGKSRQIKVGEDDFQIIKLKIIKLAGDAMFKLCNLAGLSGERSEPPHLGCYHG